MAMTLTLILLAGCASYGKKVNEVPGLVEGGQCEKAKEAVENASSCNGKDQLLCEMMFAMIDHRCGNYQASVQHLQKADNKAEQLYTHRLHEQLINIITNPGLAPYRGTEYEWVYLSYLNAINYVNLARAANDDKQRRKHLAAARIEIRRVDIKLRDIETRKGTYKEAADEKREFIHQVLRVLKVLQGDLVDSKELQFREDGYLRYLAGLVYEMLDEWDDARIDYQKAATLYEQGYTKQYGLSEGMDDQAWFDTLRMMHKAGYSKRNRNKLAKQKLDPKQRKLLQNYSKDVAQLIVIEHFDRVPESGELNMVLRVDRSLKALVLSPVPLGNAGDRQTQLAWFYMVYSDKGILRLIQKYNHGGLKRVVRSPLEKTISLGPLWDVFERNKIIRAIEKFPLRITVPYMRPLPENIGSSHLTVNGRSTSSLQSADSVAQLAMQAQLRNAGSAIFAAVARSLIQLKTVVDQLEKLGLAELSSLFPNIVSAAETRSWTLLPHVIRMTRVALKPGRHEATLIIKDPKGHELDREQRTLDIKAGQIAVWTTFTTGKKGLATMGTASARPKISTTRPPSVPGKESQSAPFGAFIKEMGKILNEIGEEQKR
ncbi:MAG: hypothetical protein GY807_02965 [Gammaproteobacteria bacterium]|nr:hypothetical protein [Gammaproteobacteria bacterium]